MKLNHLLSWALRLIVAIILLQTLYFKFTAHPDSVYIFTQLGVEPWGRIGLGITELIIAALVLWPATTLLGMIASFGIMIGAIASHLLVIGVHIAGDGGSLFVLAWTVLMASIGYMWLHRNELKLLIASFRAKWVHAK